MNTVLYEMARLIGLREKVKHSGGYWCTIAGKRFPAGYLKAARNLVRDIKKEIKEDALANKKN